MDLTDALRHRRMTRSFRSEALPADELDRVLDLARRAPAAGNTAAVAFLVLDEPDDVARYWDTTLPPERRAGFRWQGLLRAPVLVLLLTRPDAYVSRYAEPDKARTGLGASADDWPVPYWWVDAGMAAQNLLLLAADRGWGACLFGPFDHEPALHQVFGLPAGVRTVATIALGLPTGDDEPGRSAGRPRPPIEQILHRGRWHASP
jgi:nitroreductase